jgi:ATP-dependent DNA helicase RecQ
LRQVVADLDPPLQSGQNAALNSHCLLPPKAVAVQSLREILRQYWGYDSFRPLQAEAMQAVVEGRDSLVVLPTGGGKSLCFQAPALQLPGLGVIVSPLISLMKDQVDALVDCGAPAACVNSTLTIAEKRSVADDIRGGRLKLLYLSPERLMTDRTLDFLQDVPISFFAIDEAHCISEWGHDFRPEYRALSKLKERFPGVALHAYTATATEHVRHDIIRELRLENASVLVGSFDRPNLLYRVQQRNDLIGQIRDIVDRHANDSGIVYCIRRTDTEEVAAALTALGHAALPYHAGMSDEARRQNQDAFIKDRAKIIVATVAFGMGIDKSDVRYVIHAAAPKSLESYQQESGRAGRDGLEAECWLLYSAGDFNTWRRLQSELPPQAHEIAMTVLAGIENYCIGVNCRHQSILRYFGQELESENCGACDVCLSEIDVVSDPLILSQKILSCVARLNESYGGDYTAQVLVGSREQRILENGHDGLSTWGLLSEHDKKSVRGWIDQLVSQGFLDRVGEFNVLQLTDEGRQVLRGELTPRLLKPAGKTRRESRGAIVSWEGVDRGLFEQLRGFRREKADERGVPPFVVFSDATLRDLARARPSSPSRLLAIHGIGENKSAEYGGDLLNEIAAYCRETGIAMDAVRPPMPDESGTTKTVRLGRNASAAKHLATHLFAEGKSIDDVQAATGRARSTVSQYLIDFIVQEGISDPEHWLKRSDFEQIRAAASKVTSRRLRDISNALDGKFGYEDIKIALACLRSDSSQLANDDVAEYSKGP